MSNSRDQRTRLLAETLHGEWTDGPAAAMARRAAAHARRRRAARRAAVALTTATVIAAVFFLNRRSPAPAAIPAAPVVQRAYEIISDDELAALLRDRAVLELPQQNGAKKLVVLDR